MGHSRPDLPKLEEPMAVTLHLPPDVEQELQARATRIGQTLEEYLLRLAERQAGAPESAGSEPAIAYPPGFSSPKERSKAIREWAARHPRVEHFVDDSRESIYSGRGE
jgi:hypothetical protein